MIVSTLPGAASRWMQIDLPHRVARLTGAQVTHVVASDRREPSLSPPPTHERHGILTPLEVLTWGGSTREPDR